MRESLKEELHQRLLNFEAFNGAFIFIPWGLGFIYCGLYEQRLGYTYAMLSIGTVLVIWGVRKIAVNRVKLQAKMDLQVEDAKAKIIAR